MADKQELPSGYKLFVMMGRYYVTDEAGSPFRDAATKEGAIRNAIQGKRPGQSRVTFHGLNGM